MLIRHDNNYKNNIGILLLVRNNKQKFLLKKKEVKLFFLHFKAGTGTTLGSSCCYAE